MCSNGFRILIMFLFTALSFILNSYFNTIPVVIWYIVSINIFSFILFGIDKYYVSKDRKSVSHYSLYYISIIGGIFGIIFGLILFKHKKENRKFIAIEIIILLIWLFLIYLITTNLVNIQNIFK